MHTEIHTLTEREMCMHTHTDTLRHIVLTCTYTHTDVHLGSGGGRACQVGKC